MALIPSRRIAAVLCAFGILRAQTPEPAYTFETAQQFLKTYCAACHGGKSGAGGLGWAQVSSYETLQKNPQKWESILTRVRNAEMPPKGAPAPTMDSREAVTRS